MATEAALKQIFSKQVCKEIVIKYYEHVTHPILEESHHRTASETPFKWRFASGSMVANQCMLACKVIITRPVSCLFERM